MRELTVGGVVLGRGILLHLAEEDYRYGVGPVRFAVQEAIAVHRHPDGEWVLLNGRERTWRGDHAPRLLSVRVSALARAVRHPPAHEPRG